MWRTFVVPVQSVIHKQVGLLRNSSGCCTLRFYSVHVTGNECNDDYVRSSITNQDATSQNVAKAQNTVVGLLLKLHNGDKQLSRVETYFPFVQHFLDHINPTVANRSQNAELTMCTPKTKRNQDESGFGFKNIVGFEKWCYGVVVVSSLISWHRLLFKDERKKRNRDLSVWNIYDFVNVDEPLRILPVNGPAKPVDPLDAACSALDRAMADCTAVTENALAIRFSTLELHEKALAFFQSASNKGNIAALFNMGLCYEKGLGTTKDISKAVSSYTLAASHGHLKAAFNLGVIFLQGKHGKKTDGLEMMKKAGKGGLTKAQRFLGLYYADESNEYYDIKKSVQWLKIASEQNDTTAQYHLGICYERGLGVGRNMQKAKEMYARAAENGHGGAQYNYGVFHEHGLGGLSLDKHEASRWYEIAAENGNVNAKENLEYLQKQLGISKATPNLLERLFSEIYIPKQRASIMPRCSSSPDRLFMQSDHDTIAFPQESGIGNQGIACEENKCVWVV